MRPRPPAPSRCSRRSLSTLPSRPPLFLPASCSCLRLLHPIPLHAPSDVVRATMDAARMAAGQRFDRMMADHDRRRNLGEEVAVRAPELKLAIRLSSNLVTL